MLKGQAARREKALCDDTARPVDIVSISYTCYTMKKKRLANYRNEEQATKLQNYSYMTTTGIMHNKKQHYLQADTQHQIGYQQANLQSVKI